MYLGKRIRIAIVDNDRLTLGVMKMMIERILPQANVCWAVSDGLTAVSKSLNSRTRPDVLLVDMSLEGMSGCDVCRTIREETAQVDLVGMTAFSLDRYCVPALENGASCLVDKAKCERSLPCLMCNSEWAAGGCLNMHLPKVRRSRMRDY